MNSSNSNILKWTLYTALKLLQPNNFCASIDLSHAYYTVNMHPAYRKYVCFEYNGQLYQFTCLPNGFSPGPRIFTKIMKPALSILRREYGITIMSYLDDLFLTETTQQAMIDAVQHTVRLFSDQGFKISIEKSQFVPAQEIEFSGFKINTVKMTVTMTDKKAQKVIKLCTHI